MVSIKVRNFNSIGYLVYRYNSGCLPKMWKLIAGYKFVDDYVNGEQRNSATGLKNGTGTVS